MGYFVCFITKSVLTYSFVLPNLLYQPYVGLCQATRVQSHQRQSTSAVVIAICEVQVSAADYQTVPTVATGVSKLLCCRLTLTFTLTSENLSLYITLLLKGELPPCSKTVRSTSTSYHHLIGLAEIYLSEHDHQITSKSNLAGFPMVTPDTRCGV